jgi:hypothetical protein
VKQGNRLTRRPCKGDKFEIEIFEAKIQKAVGLVQEFVQKLACVGRRVTQVPKMCFACTVSQF